jgi:hypothetical protein
MIYLSIKNEVTTPHKLLLALSDLNISDYYDDNKVRLVERP